LVLCNARYLQIYGLEPDKVAPGMTMGELVELRVANGLLSDKAAGQIVDTVMRERPEAKFSQFNSYLNDDRCIAITVQPMADGRGLVTTHQDVTEQRRSEAKITHIALHDILTGLPNRVLLNEQLEKALTRAPRGELVAIHVLDLDNFKAVNDTLGHPLGDKLLKMVADRLRDQVRDIDTIARMGGDEFAVVERQISKPADAIPLARRMIDVVSEPYEIDGHQVVIGTSIGIAVGPQDGTTPDQLMRNADLALYRAKGDGRGTFHFFEPAMDALMQARRIMEHDLRKALANREFVLFYQPMVDLATNEINGFEALLRWQHPEKGMIQPGAFIPLAEEIRLIVPLGEWVIREACAAAAQWPDQLRIAVNLSVAQFRSPDLVPVVTDALATTRLAPGRLELEITETILLEGSETALATLHQLRALGVRIAMDDFGTGYSSLSYLQSFPFDKIKIDQSFIKGIVNGAGSLNIVRAVAALANGLGIVTTAEGVETTEQLDIVRSEGCTEMQGFLLSKPLPGSEVQQLLLSKPTLKTAKDGAIAA
jgi:diguanylate cyclase (GGDEF)-like protein